MPLPILLGLGAAISGIVGTAAAAVGTTAATVAGTVGTAATAASATVASAIGTTAAAVGTTASAGTVASTLGAAGLGLGVGTVATKIADMKKAEIAYEKGMNDASDIYEAKFILQAEEFNKRIKKMQETKAEWDIVKKEKDKIVQECLVYIKDLEKEKSSLEDINRELSMQKQMLLDELRYQAISIVNA